MNSLSTGRRNPRTVGQPRSIESVEILPGVRVTASGAVHQLRSIAEYVRQHGRVARGSKLGAILAGLLREGLATQQEVEQLLQPAPTLRGST